MTRRGVRAGALAGVVTACSSVSAKVGTLRPRSCGGWVGRFIKFAGFLISIAIAGAVVIHAYGPAQVVGAASDAHRWILLDAVILGALIQVVRAQRSRWLLAGHQPVSLSHSYSAMVVGHGIGDLVPVAPGGPVLRSVLTERLAGIPIPYSGGAYMVEGALDTIVPALLVPYVLLTMSLPSWAHWVLIGIAVQAALLVTVLGALALRSPERATGRLSSFVSPRLLQPARQIAEGLRALTAGGPERCLIVAGLSLLLLGLTAAQMALFLHAFALHDSVSGLLLLLVVTLSAGSLPLKIPAFGTMSAAAALPIAGIHGPVVGGYLLVTQFLLSSQTVFLAVLVLAWWFVRGIKPSRAREAIAGQKLGQVLAGTRTA
jgi:uncharacterized protein (TIRG00374 family)